MSKLIKIGAVSEMTRGDLVHAQTTDPVGNPCAFNQGAQRRLGFNGGPIQLAPYISY